MNVSEAISVKSGLARLDRRVMRRVAVLASLALVLMAAVAALVLVQGINRQITDIVHTYEVRNQARELTIALIEAESAQRGYLLTRDESYFNSYQQASATIGNRLLTLTGLTEDDAQQAERMRAIAGDIIGKSEEMGRSVELVQEQRTADARRLIETGMGERMMGGLQDALQQFVGEENSKLLDRNRQIDESRRWLVGSIITALAAAVILTYALLSRSQRKVSELALSADLLHSENEVLEAHVIDRTQALEEARAHAEQERQRVEALLQDANHRIGNSLATVSSLLGLQMLRSKSDEVKEALEGARSRVHAIASAHRRLRLGNDLETASADEFLGAVLEDIAVTATTARNVTMRSDFDPIVVNARDATTIGILVGELVTNALKHAFPDGREGTILVSLKDEAGVPVLRVADDGVGLGEGHAMGEQGLGSVIVVQLSNQFGGAPVYERREQGGLSVSVPMPGLGNEKAAMSD
ncbi:MAG: CHASE3 domain-containing protein [Candidatus Devosia phytovorans]|uniref:histidine kinase n=1 Tax=Candidatus Devosia phytovorans TaxID=3121372 RepID=A0AAJ6B233_9HYPH|nr:CHASE3 domain-containing protein [Devosia sp.]WEK05078.1 MAG: CHASE3 domain-containing protein [Devosia sp.]